MTRNGHRRRRYAPRARDIRQREHSIPDDERRKEASSTANRTRVNEPEHDPQFRSSPGAAQ